MTQSNAIANPFQKLTTFKGRGYVTNSMVGPGSTLGVKFLSKLRIFKL